MANNVFEVNEEGPVEGAGKGEGAEAGNCGRCGVKVGKVDEEKGNLSARFGFFFLIEWFSILSLYKNNFIIVFISKEHRYLYTIYKRDIPEKA